MCQESDDYSGAFASRSNDAIAGLNPCPRARVPRRTAAYFAPRLTGLINHWSLERLHAGTT